MASKDGTKPLTRRPLDLLYYAFLLIHLLYTSTIGILPLWPDELRTRPGFDVAYRLFKGVVDDYIAKSNDPFMLAAWGLVQREWEFAHFKLFLWIEAAFFLPSFILGMVGLQTGSTKVYPLLLAYSSAALVTTLTTLHITLIAPSSNDADLDPASRFYALTDDNRSTILGPLIPFLAIPAIMWLDMIVRISRLVHKGTQVEAQARMAGKGKGKKEL